MPFLSPNQQCQSTEEKNITFHGLAYPKLTWVAMPLISPLMTVPQQQHQNTEYKTHISSFFLFLSPLFSPF